MLNIEKECSVLIILMHSLFFLLRAPLNNKIRNSIERVSKKEVFYLANAINKFSDHHLSWNDIYIKLLFGRLFSLPGISYVI